MSKQKTQSEKYQLLRLASRNYRAIIVTQKEELEAIIQSPNIHIVLSLFLFPYNLFLEN